MMDRPDAATLLRAMAETLTDQVLPATSGAAQHATRVVANLCRILERESLAGGRGVEQSRSAVEALLSDAGSGEDVQVGADQTEDWACRLDERLRASDEAFDLKAREILRADVRRRLEINRPGYDS